LNLLGKCRNARDQRIEDFKLEPQGPVSSAGDLRLKRSQFSGGEPDLAGQCLAVDECLVERRSYQLVAMLCGHLDEVAKHVVVFDLEAAHLRLIGVASL